MEIKLKDSADKRRGFARREFIASRTRLKELLEQGHTIASAHDELMAEGIVSMKYRTFAEYLKNDSQKKEVAPHTLQEPTRRIETNIRKPHKASIDRLGVDKNEVDNLLKPVE